MSHDLLNRTLCIRNSNPLTTFLFDPEMTWIWGMEIKES